MVEFFLRQSFRVHNFACDVLIRHLSWIKRALLVVAFGSFLGVGFPELRKDFGELSLNILLGLLFLSPLSRIFRVRLLLIAMGLRREFGILMGCFALVHALGYLRDPIWIDWFIIPYLNDIFGMDRRFLYGFIALGLTLPVLFTSNTLSQRVLGRNWKRLHRLVYPLLLFTLLHKFVRTGSTDFMGIIEASAVFAAYLTTKLLAWKNFLPPLRAAIGYVSARYSVYQGER